MIRYKRNVEIGKVKKVTQLIIIIIVKNSVFNELNDYNRSISHA